MAMKGVVTLIVAMTVVGALAAAPQVKRNVLKAPPEDCSMQASAGDIAYIIHQGYHRDELIDSNPTLPDGAPEPLAVFLGKNRVRSFANIFYSM